MKLDIKKKAIVFSSILLLGTGVLLGCEGERDQATAPPAQEATPPETTPGAPPAEQAAPVQPSDQATAEQPKDQATAEKSQDQATTEQSGQATAKSGSQELQSGQTQASQDQANQEWVGKQVVSNDDQELGTVSAMHDSGYVMIKGEGDKLHPVPADLLEKDSQGDRLKATFDRNTFQQAPSFSEAEQKQLSDTQLEEVRGYYENKSQGGQQAQPEQSQQGSQQAPSDQSQGQQPQDQQSQNPPGTGTQKGS